MRRAALIWLTLGGTTLAAAPADPWPSAPVLTRLFLLPEGRNSQARLIKDLRLTPSQVSTLRHLADSESALAQQAQNVLGRENAAALNNKINLFNAEKDRKVREALEGSYPKFRQWIKVWWAEEVKKARR